MADAAYRRAVMSFVTEMEGYLPAFGDLIAVSHDIAGWGKSGEVETWNGVFLVCSEDLDWSVGDNYAIFSSEQGDVLGPYKVIPGGTARSMSFLEGAPPAGTFQTGTEQERTRYAMGAASSYAKMCRVLSILPRAGDVVQIRAVVEDNRVHSADLPYMEGPSGGSGSRRTSVYMANETPVYNASSDVQHAHGGYYGDDDGQVGTPLVEGYGYDA